jgi:DNA-binding HxlR family transcriptional regulator
MSHSHIDVSALASEACPVSEVLDHVSGKWSIGILVAVAQGPVRFTELERSIRGISRRMLTLTLRKLERDGLLVRTVYPVVPPKVEYTLTQMARELHQSLRELTDWARRHGNAVAAAQAAYDREQIPALPAGCTRDPRTHRAVDAEGGGGGVVGRPGAEEAERLARPGWMMPSSFRFLAETSAPVCVNVAFQALLTASSPGNLKVSAQPSMLALPLLLIVTSAVNAPGQLVAV